MFFIKVFKELLRSLVLKLLKQRWGTNCQINAVNAKTAMHSVLGRKTERERSPPAGGRRGDDQTKPAQQPQKHLPVTSVGHHRRAEPASSSESPSLLLFPILTFQIKIIGKMTCLRCRVSSPASPALLCHLWGTVPTQLSVFLLFG